MSNAQLAADLRAARALLLERGWCQGALGRDAAGAAYNATFYLPCAVCLCGYGAAILACSEQETVDDDEGQRSEAVLRALCHATPGICFITWQDEPGRTLAEVLAVFCRAIAAVEREGRR